MDEIILEARESVRGLNVTPAKRRRRSHLVSFADVLTLASRGLNTSEIASELGFPVGTIRGAIRSHGYRWRQTGGNGWTLAEKVPDVADVALARRVCDLALGGLSNAEIGETVGRSVHAVPGLMPYLG